MKPEAEIVQMRNALARIVAVIPQPFPADMFYIVASLKALDWALDNFYGNPQSNRMEKLLCTLEHQLRQMPVNEPPKKRRIQSENVV